MPPPALAGGDFPPSRGLRAGVAGREASSVGGGGRAQRGRGAQPPSMCAVAVAFDGTAARAIRPTRRPCLWTCGHLRLRRTGPLVLWTARGRLAPPPA